MWRVVWEFTDWAAVVDVSREEGSGGEGQLQHLNVAERLDTGTGSGAWDNGGNTSRI